MEELLKAITDSCEFAGLDYSFDQGKLTVCLDAMSDRINHAFIREMRVQCYTRGFVPEETYSDKKLTISFKEVQNGNNC